MAYKGVFSGFENPQKYVGDISRVTYRSAWERSVMVWCDKSPAIKQWSSETVTIGYYDPVSNKERTYYVDFFLELADGRQILVEVKPHRQTSLPKPPQRRTQKFIMECKTWETNQAKWFAARQFAELYGMRFEVWTENELKKLGIIQGFAAGDKALMKAERRAMPASKYNPTNRKRKPTTRPKRRS